MWIGRAHRLFVMARGTGLIGEEFASADAVMDHGLAPWCWLRGTHGDKPNRYHQTSGEPANGHCVPFSEFLDVAWFTQPDCDLQFGRGGIIATVPQVSGPSSSPPWA